MAGIGKAPQALDKSEVIFQKAAETALGIDDNRLRAHTLWTIASEQIRAGDESGARKTKTLAKQATGEIKSSLSQVWMFSEIAAGHATEGEDTDAWAAFDQGVLVARTIDNAWGRARASVWKAGRHSYRTDQPWQGPVNQFRATALTLKNAAGPSPLISELAANRGLFYSRPGTLAWTRGWVIPTAKTMPSRNQGTNDHGQTCRGARWAL